LAKRYVRDAKWALTIAERLESAQLRPNRAGPYYMIYIATTDLLGLAEKDEAIRRAIALYLAEKAKNDTPRQKEIAEKILKRHPLFLTLSASSRREDSAGKTCRDLLTALLPQAKAIYRYKNGSVAQLVWGLRALGSARQRGGCLVLRVVGASATAPATRRISSSCRGISTRRRPHAAEP